MAIFEKFLRFMIWGQPLRCAGTQTAQFAVRSLNRRAAWGQVSANPGFADTKTQYRSASDRDRERPSVRGNDRRCPRRSIQSNRYIPFFLTELNM
jgi:hypothetical protein